MALNNLTRVLLNKNASKCQTSPKHERLTMIHWAISGTWTNGSNRCRLLKSSTQQPPGLCSRRSVRVMISVQLRAGIGKQVISIFQKIFSPICFSGFPLKSWLNWQLPWLHLYSKSSQVWWKHGSTTWFSSWKVHSDLSLQSNSF